MKSQARPGRSSSCGIVLKGRLGQVYNEDAFHYFLDIERRRAAPRGRPLLLVLIGLKDGDLKAGMQMDAALADKLFSQLWLCLRDTDVIGWYRENRVAGALLTSVTENAGPDAPESIRKRVQACLSAGLRSFDAARRVQVHVYPLRPGVKQQ